jgi:hypothetical protein
MTTTKQTHYVLDHNTELVGPMSELDAKRIAFLLNRDGFGYNVLTGIPEDYPVTGRIIDTGEWVLDYIGEPNETNVGL